MIDVAMMLQDFEQRCVELRRLKVRDRSRPEVRELHRLHDELLVLAREALAPDSALDLVAGAERAFASGVLALHHYAMTVDGELENVDTVGSKTLEAFRTDWDLGVLSEEELRGVLDRAFSFDQQSWRRIDDAMAVELAELTFRCQVIAALERRCPLSSQEMIHRLFTELYPGHPFQLGDVDVVRTSTSLFFCLAYTKEKLDVPGFEERPEQQQAAVAAFLRRLHEVKQEHFPVFGFFRADQAEASLLADLAADTMTTGERVAKMLTTMVSILRSQDIDKYLVHDAWGHQWQAHLFPFEEQYRASGRFRRLPPLDQVTEGPGGWSGSLIDACRAGVAVLDESGALPKQHWDGYLRGVMVDRLMVAGVIAIAEMLADVSEFKIHVIGGEAAVHLSSSSYFPKWPTKLDLTLMDAGVVFGMALEGFERLAASDGKGGYLHKRLLVELPQLSERRAEALIDSLRNRVRTLLQTEFKAEFSLDSSGEALVVNPFARLCLNLLGTHTALNGVYAQLGADDRSYPPPLRDFRDLLLLSIGAFYQQDPDAHFWHVDEFTALCFEPCLDRFCAALEAGD